MLQASNSRRINRIVLTLVLALTASVSARDARSTFDLLKKGSSLSAKDAAKLEERVQKKPNDAESRIQLLAYYVAPQGGADLAAAKSARLRHILWVIENDPQEGLGLFQVATGVYRVHCQGDDLADPEGFQRYGELWLDQAKRHPEDLDIRRAAVDAVQYCWPEKAEKIMSEAHDQSGLGRLYATAVLGVTGQSYVNSDPAGSDPALRERPFAKRALEILQEANEKELVLSAAGSLLRTGATLWADGKLDWDYTPLGSSLLAKARKAAPDAMTLVTLPTTLPARGERPPSMIRVGGNVQSEKIVRKITPPYPPAARDAGVQGTVQMTAVIGLDGKILYLHPDAGPAELIDASLEAVRQWEYKPTLLNGRPCFVVTRIDVNYTLSQP